MKVLLPNNTSHSISFYPRFEPTNTLSLEVLKEGYNSSETITPTYLLNNGVMTLNFDLDGIEQDRFSFDLLEGNNIVYIGKLFFTEQNTQDFKLTKDTYIYV